MTVVEVTLPNDWRPRDYQLPVWRYLERGGKRAAIAWHRRAGKDDLALHWAACAAMRRTGSYWHMLPEAAQARKAIWDAVNPRTGRRRIDDAFPPALREVTRENEMFIRLHGGSTWQVVGSDNFHALVGSPPVGVVFSEYSRADPGAWAYLRPILAENGGWAIFISTFLGRNHHFELVRNAIEWPDWFGQILSADETGVFTPEQLASERAEMIAAHGEEEGDALYRQEYLSDPSASVMGSYYGPQMAKAEKAGRVTNVPYERSALVYTGWDLGANDVTAIWFAQVVGLEPRVIDYYQNNNQDTAHYAEVLKKRGYAYGGHFLPHDGGNRTIHANLSVNQILKSLGLANVYVTRRARDESQLLSDINAARGLIEKAMFDRTKCERGLDALRNYRREWDDDLRQFRRTPRHDWASDGADAFRTLAVNWSRVEGETSIGFDAIDGWRDMAVA
jgi:hypothetical protein